MPSENKSIASRLIRMSKQERSLLIYLETRMVDYAGHVDLRHMNSDDMKIVDDWKLVSFIEFGRRKMAEIDADPRPQDRTPTHWVRFSEDAWLLAHAERRARNVRMINAVKLPADSSNKPPE